MRRSARAWVLAMAIGALTSAPAAAQPDGKALYEKGCVKCHGTDGKAQTKQGRLVKAHSFFDEPKLATGEAPAHVLTSIREKKKHKPVAKKLDDEQIRAVGEYVRFLVGSGE